MDEYEPLEPEELEEESGEPLPDREAMSTIKPPLDPVLDPPVYWELPVEPRDGV
jgi:hypothetical protein